MSQPSAPRIPAGRCIHCWLRTDFCICSTIEPRTIRTDLVLLRHWREARKPSNTGRIARLAIPEIQIHDYGDPSISFSRDDLGVEGAHLLMPDPHPDKAPSLQSVERLIIPDGTWGQSRRMCTRLGLNDLPKIHLPLPRADTIRLRKPPGPWAMSTLEALAMALHQTESIELGEHLLALHERFVRASRAQRGLSIPDSTPID